jgi:hypothetical protein
VCRHRVAISAEGVTDQTASTAATYRWEAITRLVRDRKHLYLYVTAASAIIIPRKAFDSDEEFDDFIAAVEVNLPRRVSPAPLREHDGPVPPSSSDAGA